jgi:hypothetical protein
MSQFDPYLNWLGIPPEEQPPHFYRLLGLTLFETSPELIAYAAERQMYHVSAFQNGPYVEMAQFVLNEMAAARACLLDPQQKAYYDQHLYQSMGTRGEMQVAPPPPPVAAQPPHVPVAGPPAAAHLGPAPFMAGPPPPAMPPTVIPPANPPVASMPPMNMPPAGVPAPGPMYGQSPLPAAAPMATPFAPPGAGGAAPLLPPLMAPIMAPPPGAAPIAPMAAGPVAAAPIATVPVAAPAAAPAAADPLEELAAAPTRRRRLLPKKKEQGLSKEMIMLSAVGGIACLLGLIFLAVHASSPEGTGYEGIVETPASVTPPRKPSPPPVKKTSSPKSKEAIRRVRSHIPDAPPVSRSQPPRTNYNDGPFNETLEPNVNPGPPDHNPFEKPPEPTAPDVNKFPADDAGPMEKPPPR